MALYRASIESEEVILTLACTILCSFSREEALKRAMSNLPEDRQFNVIASSSVSHDMIYLSDDDGNFYSFKVSDYI
jgi:hypothetical protein